MKLSLKELEFLSKELGYITCTGDPLYKKINDKINHKKKKIQLKIEKKEAEKRIKKYNDCYDWINRLREFNKKEETLCDLVNSISAICGIDSNISRDEDIAKTILTINANDLKDGELERIIKVKNAGHNIFIKLID